MKERKESKKGENRMEKKAILYQNNIWDKDNFRSCCMGGKWKLFAIIRRLKNCICWSKQRIVRGYADCDRWDMFSYLQKLIPDMLQDLRENHQGSPGYLGENYVNEDGILVNDTCHEEWDAILDRMIFLWRESDEDTCTKKNRFEHEYMKALDEFIEKYGFGGEKLQTEKELEKRKCGGYSTLHFMDELPEYREIANNHYDEERKLEEYREKAKDEAMDMLKQYFFSLWD